MARLIRSALSMVGFVIVLAVSGCSITADAAGANVVGSRLPAESLAQFGDFESLSMDGAPLGDEFQSSAQALGNARDADFGRADVPEASLVRVIDSDGGLLPLPNGSVVWVFRWSGLQEDYYKAFPRDDGKPNETVFVYTEYFAFVDAKTGIPIAGVRH